jgi:hypothetical protein
MLFHICKRLHTWSGCDSVRHDRTREENGLSTRHTCSATHLLQIGPKEGQFDVKLTDCILQVRQQEVSFQGCRHVDSQG